VFHVPVARAGTLLERHAMWIAGGGSSVAGTLGYVSAGFEILSQAREGHMPAPDVVYVALGSAGTFAGLAWSLWAEREIEVVGVDVAGQFAFSERRAKSLISRLDRSVALLRGARPRGRPPVVRVEKRFSGRYGLPTRAS